MDRMTAYRVSEMPKIARRRMVAAYAPRWDIDALRVYKKAAPYIAAERLKYYYLTHHTRP